VSEHHLASPLRRPATITYPLELMLRDSGCQWIVREGAERFRDGLTGLAMRWNGARFATEPDGTLPDVERPEPGAGDLQVQITTLHPASPSLQLGASTEAAVRVVTGSDPTGWGISEPVTHPWSPREITTLCRDRAPTSTQLVVTGNGVLGQVLVERTETALREQVRLSGPRAGVVDGAAIESLAADLAGTARSMIVAAHPGRRDGLRTGVPTPPALPYAILVGHPVVAEQGVAHAEQVPVTRYAILGDGVRQACWCRLDAGPGRPYELLNAVLAHFGVMPSGGVGNSPLPAGVRRPGSGRVRGCGAPVVGCTIARCRSRCTSRRRRCGRSWRLRTATARRPTRRAGTAACLRVTSRWSWS
jgi:hypothetical protein